MQFLNQKIFNCVLLFMVYYPLVYFLLYLWRHTVYSVLQLAFSLQ